MAESHPPLQPTIPQPVPLRLRFPDGTEKAAGDWLEAELAKITREQPADAATRPAE